jgi:intracellular sulfur oxidation DsrE/DsrF family protein
MTENIFSDDKLNLFIDEQLDTDERDLIHQAMLNDNVLRERVCQLKAVRELVNYAYENVPEPEQRNIPDSNYTKRSLQGIAAGLLIGLGVATGWIVNDNTRSTNQVASANDVFQYFKDKAPAERTERKIIIHVTTGDIAAVNAALNEAEQLLASYQESDTPMKLDIITNKEGINMLRVGVSPYVDRIERIIDTNENVSFYACQRSIQKAVKKEGKNIMLLPHAVTTKTAQELISDRLDKGWVYIKV